jgi:hypothetical protein
MPYTEIWIHSSIRMFIKTSIGFFVNGEEERVRFFCDVDV